MNDSPLTGASYPLKIGSKTFNASPLTDRDYVELDNYIKSEVMKTGRIGLEFLNPTERAEQLQATVKAASASGWGTPEGAKIINTIEGTIRIGWQMIQKKHPKVTLEQFTKLCIVEGDREQVRQNLFIIDEAYIMLNTIQKEGDGDASAPEEQGGSSSTKSTEGEDNQG